MAAPAASPRLCASTRPRLRPATGTAMQKSRAHHIRHSLGPDCSITRIVPMIVPAPLALYSTGACAALCVYVYCTYALPAYVASGSCLSLVLGLRCSLCLDVGAWPSEAERAHMHVEARTLFYCVIELSHVSRSSPIARTRACDIVVISLLPAATRETPRTARSNAIGPSSESINHGGDHRTSSRRVEAL
jgi:hypothetical protein